MWLRLWARFQVEDLFIDLQMLKFSLQWLLVVTNRLLIYCTRPPCADAHMPQQTPLKT
jgi:hypothetical protein